MSSSISSLAEHAASASTIHGNAAEPQGGGWGTLSEKLRLPKNSRHPVLSLEPYNTHVKPVIFRKGVA